MYFSLYIENKRDLNQSLHTVIVQIRIYIYTDLKDIETLEIGEVISSNFSLCNLYDNIEKGRSVYAMQMLIDKT